MQALPKDRRVKLSDQDKLDIISLHKEGRSITGLARDYNVNKRLIQFILFPERQEKNKADREERGGWKQYYSKEKHRVSMADHRAYKKSLKEQGTDDK